MCQQCQDALDAYYPQFSREDQRTLLWGATAFPMGCGETVARQIRENFVMCGLNLNKCLAKADHEMSEQMAQIRNA